jgi:hypothetical protein
MAQSYFWTVVDGPYTRSNTDGSQTVFQNGETVETSDANPPEKQRLRAMTPGKPPDRDGAKKD